MAPTTPKISARGDEPSTAAAPVFWGAPWGEVMVAEPVGVRVALKDAVPFPVELTVVLEMVLLPETVVVRVLEALEVSEAEVLELPLERAVDETDEEEGVAEAVLPEMTKGPR